VNSGYRAQKLEIGHTQKTKQRRNAPTSKKIYNGESKERCGPYRGRNIFFVGSYLGWAWYPAS